MAYCGTRSSFTGSHTVVLAAINYGRLMLLVWMSRTPKPGSRWQRCTRDYRLSRRVVLAAALKRPLRNAVPEKSQRSITDLAVVGMCTFGFGLGLGHVRTSFGLAIPLRAFAVVDVGRGI